MDDAESSVGRAGRQAEVVSALPADSLTHIQYKALEQSDSFESCAPLIADTTRQRITHLSLQVGETNYFLGWDPDDEHWVQIITFEWPEEMGEVEMDIDVLEVFDDDTGEPLLEFDLDEENFIDSIHAHVKNHAEYAYDDTDNLWFIIDEGREVAEETRSPLERWS